MDIGTVQTTDIDQEMRTAYLDYAMSVIVSRALPDARDGLKPVHRRILYAMHDMGIRANGSFKKSARIVGEVLGKYHPHGDSAVYESMARMAQDFSMRYMLVDGQGNFGSVDGDSPAAMRYTEARFARIAEEMLTDIDKDTVNFTANFDDSLMEPDVLPSQLPNLLLNGATGIAVGMATNIPPHNLGEVTQAVAYVIDHYDDLDSVSMEDLMQYVKGPDFPTGGTIVGQEGIRQAYSTGRGRIVIRAKSEIKEIKNGRFAIMITEIPYQVNKSTLIERIAELVRSGKIDMISDLRDESDRNGMSIYIELKKNAQPKRVLNKLLKFTALQSTFGVNLLALVDGEPRTLTLKRCLKIFVDHRSEVITRRSQFELEKARQRAHILDGLLIALANLDDVIATIRQSPDTETAKERLMSRFKLSDVQAQAILDMQLRRLSALERQKIEDEYKQIMDRIAFLEDLLAHPKKILAMIKDSLLELTKKYDDDRRTMIAIDAHENFNEEDLVQDEPTLISITHRGYIKRVAPNTYRTTGRGRRGVSGQGMRDEDEVLNMIHARTLQTILFFTNKGKVYSEKVYQIPLAGRTDRGVPIVNVISISPDEVITAMVAVKDFTTDGFCIMTTAKGLIKRVELSQFSSVRPSGLIAISLEKDDTLGWVRVTNGSNDIIMVTHEGKALRMSEALVRPMGRQARGVRAMKLSKTDQMQAVEVVEEGGFLLVVTEKGYGKRTPLSAYMAKGRGTKGMFTIDTKAVDKIGRIAAACVIQDGEEITLMSSNGIVLRLKANGISITGRATRGVRMMDIHEGDHVASLARIRKGDTTVEKTEGSADDEAEVEENAEIGEENLDHPLENNEDDDSSSELEE
ncbi:MAG: DNA gyrase subunit A [Anaerolineaceae bacterium]|nr:DNA gyrase subunit A [Anaerolineaceae bacterium]